MHQRLHSDMDISNFCLRYAEASETIMYRYHIMETRTFRLSSYDISPSNNLADYYKQTVTTQYGKVADNRMSLTWNNVNLQQIVGDDFYNAYNRFTIRLVNHAWFNAPTSDSGTALNPQIYQDGFVNVYLNGLPFYPPVYNSPNGALVNTINLGIMSTTAGGTAGGTGGPRATGGPL